MGTLCSSAINNRGQIFIMKLLILLTALATVALAEPWGYYGYPAVYNVPSLQWPGVRAPGFSQTTFGLRGKRSAEADAEPHYGYYGYPYAYGGFYGYPYARYAYGPGVAAHPGGATSSTYRSPQGIGKRSADPEPFHPFYGFYGYPYYVRPVVGPVDAPEGTGVAAHPGLATSFVSRSAQGAKAKRSAEAEPAYGYYGYGYGFPYYHQQSWPSYRAPGFSSTVWGLRG